MKKKVLISTGGSGGHVIPAITIYDHLKSRYKTVISTDIRGLKYIDKENYRSIIINTPKLNNLFFLPFAFLKIFFLTIKCLILLKKEKISILISTGGYMSLPLCLAAKVLDIKIFLIEPNMVLGRANKFFLNFSKKILCYYRNLLNLPKKFEQKQIIIRPLIRKKYYEKNNYQKENGVFNIIIIGGSQGASIFDTVDDDVWGEMYQAGGYAGVFIAAIIVISIIALFNLSFTKNKNSLALWLFFVSAMSFYIHRNDFVLMIGHLKNSIFLLLLSAFIIYAASGSFKIPKTWLLGIMDEKR